MNHASNASIPLDSVESGESIAYAINTEQIAARDGEVLSLERGKAHKSTKVVNKLSASEFFSSASLDTNSKSSTFRFGGTQTFSLRQLWPLKAYIFSKQCMARNETPLFNGENAIISLGVGANMVESIYYWARCLNILNDKAQPTPFAQYLLGDIDADNYLSVDEVAAFNEENHTASARESSLGLAISDNSNESSFIDNNSIDSNTIEKLVGGG